MQEIQFQDGGQFEPLTDEQRDRVLNEFKRWQESANSPDLLLNENGKTKLENTSEKA